ncbi:MULTISPECIES: putative phage tail protein [Clostridium]|uniref:Phage tail protein n=1 Tax=Clostridium frigoriphilum TaxID=443253 RepID=A0ABU7UUK3_9CLOT|nr:putative phage tail protein [Clostridium sp. DSM 17811]MBU3098753.1 YmfQ family protein [Clostridium sp. DSM 17811]
MDSKTLLGYMPKYYVNSKVISNLNTTNAKELTIFKAKIESTLNQFFTDTTDTMIERWEAEFGILSNTNLTLTQRRNKVLAKIRGRGVSTISAIKSIAQSYVDTVNVIENNPDYSFLLDLVSSSGFPYILSDLYSSVEEMKPAHLKANYKMTSKTCDSLTIRTFLLCGEEIMVYPYQTREIETNGKINIALGQSQGAEIITISPKGAI